jgi:hypothetical protein
MPRRYKTLEEEKVFGFTWIQSAYGLLKPIEEKLRAGGYSGPILADFDNGIYSANKVIDVEATRKRQEEADKRKGGKAPNVAPIYKTSNLSYVNREYESEDKYTIRIESNVAYMLPLSKDATKDFLAYLKKVEDYLDLLIKNILSF